MRSTGPCITTNLAAASAVVLAAGLVAVPPEIVPARTEVRAVHLAAAFALPPAAAALLDTAGGDQRQIVVAVPSDLLSTADTAPSPQNVRRSGAATQAVAPTIDSSQITADAVPAPTVDSIFGGLLVGAFFFVVIPAFLVVILVASAIDVVLGALGLPLLGLVPDPPFGPTPSAPAAATALSEPPTGGPAGPELKKTDQLSTASVTPRKRKPESSTETVEASDTATTSKPLTNVTKDSPDFTPKRPKHHDDEKSSADSDLAPAQEGTTTDTASGSEQHPLGHADKKQKPDTDDAER